MRIGIDFGTCFSSAAFMDGKTLTVVKDPAGLSFSVPSSVFVTPKGEVLVGKIADNQRLRDTKRYRHEIKRDLGKTSPLLLGEHPYLPEELIASILSKIKDDADMFMTSHGHSSSTGVVLTVPTTHQQFKRDLMLKAAAQAGFLEAEVTLLEEPVAAAHYYARENKMSEGEILLVYDLGGGTFDTALLQKRGAGFEYLALPTGIERCGGVDFDRAIYNDVIKQNPELQSQIQSELTDAAALMARVNLGEDCIALKHQLSELGEAEISFVAPKSGNPIKYHLTRQAFNEMIASAIQETITCCEQMLHHARITPEQIAHILLVGGSCRIPYVQQVLRQQFKQPIATTPNMELVVCQGAALYAAMHKIHTVSATPGAADYTTISAAVQQAEFGGRIVVRPGTYRETLILDREVSIVGVGPPETVIVESSTPMGVQIATQQATIRGITFQHTSNKALTWHERGALAVTQGYLTLENCIIEAQGHGISIWGVGSKALIRKCRVQAGKNAGIAVTNGAVVEIEDCEITGCVDTGVDVRNSGSAITMQRCRVHDNDRLGISISSGGQLSLDNCAIFSNGPSGIQVCDENSFATIKQTRIYEGKGKGLSVWQKGSATIDEDCDISANLHAGVFISDEGSTATIKESSIHDGHYVGIDITNKGRVSMEDCAVYRNAGVGIRSKDEGSQVTSVRCRIYEGGYTGILISEKGLGDFQACEILSNAGTGISIRSAGSKATIQDCRIHSSAAIGVVVEDDGEVVLGNCTIERNKMDIYIEPGSVLHISAPNKIPTTVDQLQQLLQPVGTARDVVMAKQASTPEQHTLLPSIKSGEFTLARTLKGHTSYVYSLAISPDGRLLVSGSRDKTAKTWNLQTGELLRTSTDERDRVYGVAINPDGRTFVSGNEDTTVNIWNLATGQHLRALSGHSVGVGAVTISPDGQLLVSGSGDKTIKVWNFSTGRIIHTLLDHTSFIWRIVTSPDGQLLVSGGGDKFIKIWSLSTGRLIRTLSGHTSTIRGLAISSDGKTLVSGGEDKTIRVWDMNTGQHIRTLLGHERGVFDLALSSDDKVLVSGSWDKTVKLWNMPMGQLLTTLSEHTGSIWSVAISPDGRTLVSGDVYGTIHVWEKE